MIPVLERLAELNLPWGDWVILGSGPLWAQGLIPDLPNDVDVLARGAAWRRVCELGRPRRAALGDLVVRLEDGALEIFDGWAPMEWDLDEVIDAAEWRHGFPWAPLHYVLEFKRVLARPKDLEHIRLIEEFLAGQH